MEIREENYNGYTYVVIKLKNSEDKEILEQIKKKAKETADKVNAKSPSGFRRSLELRYWNNLGGILAEEVVKIYLNNIIEANKINAEVLEEEFTTYEDHRDIKIKVAEEIKTLEVRSSFNYLASLQNVLSGKFSLIGQYTTSYKNLEPDKDFYITIIHRYRNEEIENKLNNEVEVFIVGGASKERFRQIGKQDDKKLKQGSAKYLIISPITQSNNVPDLFKEIFGIKENKLKDNTRETKQRTLF